MSIRIHAMSGAWCLAQALAALGAVDTTRPVHACPGRKVSGTQIISRFGLVQISVPRKLVVRKSGDVDYVAYRIGFRSNGHVEWMRIMLGPSLGSGEPDVTRSASVRWVAREWKCDTDLIGHEWVGTVQDGRKSRSVKFPFGIADYAEVSAAAASAFDGVLDGMCCGKAPRSERNGE